jgi:hypothetical protein
MKTKKHVNVVLFLVQFHLWCLPECVRFHVCLLPAYWKRELTPKAKNRKLWVRVEKVKTCLNFLLFLQQRKVNEVGRWHKLDEEAVHQNQNQSIYLFFFNKNQNIVNIVLFFRLPLWVDYPTIKKKAIWINL